MVDLGEEDLWRAQLYKQENGIKSKMAEKYQSRKTKKESHLKDISVHCRIFRVFFFARQKFS